MAKIINIVQYLWDIEQIAQNPKYGKSAVWFAHDLQFGKLPRDFSKKEIARMKGCYYGKYENIERAQKPLTTFFSNDFHSYDEVVVWHGDDANSLQLLYLMSYITPNNLYEVSLEDAMNSIEGLRLNVHQDKNWHYDFENLACGEMERCDFFSVKKKIPKEVIECYQEKWKSLVDANSNYRLNGENGDVIPYPDDFMDDELKAIFKEPVSKMKGAGQMMAISKWFLSDAVIIKRIDELNLTSSAIGPILRKNYLSRIDLFDLYNKLKSHYSDNEIEKMDFSYFNTFDTIVSSVTHSEFIPWCDELPSLEQIRNECSFKGYRIVDDKGWELIVRDGDVEFKIIAHRGSSCDDGYEVLCRRYNIDVLDSQTYLHCSAPDFIRFIDYITESSNNLLNIVRENLEAVSQSVLNLIDS